MKIYTLRHVPDETVEVACRRCSLHKRFMLAELLEQYSPDLYLDIFVRVATQFCDHRKPYSGLPACEAYTPQMGTARKAVADRNAADEARQRKEAVQRAEAAIRQEERAENAPVRLFTHNGWRFAEAIPTGTRPKFRWKQSWQDNRPEDIIGFDGDRPIGRVFQLDPYTTSKDVWFWILYGVEERRRKRPGQGAGWEESRLLAACRVEWCYEKMLEEEAWVVKRQGKA